jgi:hypothetical protein
VAGLYEPAVAVPGLKPIEDKEPDVTLLLRKVLDEVAAGKASPEAFKSDRPDDLPEMLADLRDDLHALGPTKSLQLVERKEEEGKRKYTYRGKYNDWTVLLNLSLTPGNKIAGLHVSPD